jgi:hypothetical protein
VIELIEFAQQVTDLIIKVYALGEDPGFESANRKPMVSLRELLDKAGLTPGFILEQNTT